jgi:hypothetical protein
MGAFALLALSAAVAAAPPAHQAEEVARSMMKAMGGQDAWNRARFIRFDFIVTVNGRDLISRAHLWDKQTGRYRIEDKAADGESGVVIFSSIARQQGCAYVAGRKLEGAAAARALKAAYASYLNDVYWLAMPWKWLDPGVHLKYLGRKERGGQTFDVVELTFARPAPNAGDRYEAYVSTRSHLMERWEYVLHSGEKGAWDWQYAATGGIKLARNHTNGAGASIGMGDVRVLNHVNDAFLTDPNRWLAQMPK